MSTLKPVEIIGGGLAGLGLGIGLRRAGVPVRILEAGDYPRHRVCGEFITGLPAATAERLGITQALAGSLRHTGVHWYSGDRPLGRMRLPAPAIGVSRFKLDAQLAALFVEQGGELVTRHRVGTDLSGEGRVQTIGRRRSAESTWVGLKAHVRGAALTDDLEMHLGDGAYVGLAQVEDGWTNVCGLFRRDGILRGDSPEALAATLRGRGLTALADRVAKAELRAGSNTAIAGFVFNPAVVAPAGVGVGDCCGAIPPFTGHGMAMAFIGADCALGPLVDWSEGRASWEATAQRVHVALQREFRTRLRVASWLHPLLLGKGGRAVLGVLARSQLLPLRTLYHVLH